MGLYIEPKRLAELVREMQAGEMSAELLDIIRHITRGLMRRRQFQVQGADYDDVQQAIYVAVWQYRNNIDPEANVFAYLTMVVQSQFAVLIRKKAMDKKKMGVLVGRQFAEHAAKGRRVERMPAKVMNRYTQFDERRGGWHYGKDKH